MPWRSVSPMEERKKAVELALSGRFTKTEVATAFGVSRKTLHKWIARFLAEGEAGLEDASRARVNSGRVCEFWVDAIVSIRRQRRGLGPKKIENLLSRAHPEEKCPAKSTIGEVLKREGLIEAKARRPGGRQLRLSTWSFPEQPNQEWAVDYKGQWRLGDGTWSYPLTVTDGATRFLLCSDTHAAVCGKQTKKSMTKVFAEYGLPAAIRSDRGTPFASVGYRMSLTRLSVWWLKLGIELHRIAPGRPTQNSRHERMHRDLKADVMSPLQPTAKAQQAQLDVFRHQYNWDRPHESLAMKMPAELYTPSPRQLPSRLRPFDYPSHFERYRVRSNGTIALRRRELFISEALSGEIVGLEQHESGWKVYLGGYLLADIAEKNYTLVYIH